MRKMNVYPVTRLSNLTGKLSTLFKSPFPFSHTLSPFCYPLSCYAFLSHHLPSPFYSPLPFSPSHTISPSASLSSPSSSSLNLPPTPSLPPFPLFFWLPSPLACKHSSRKHAYTWEVCVGCFAGWSEGVLLTRFVNTL